MKKNVVQNKQKPLRIMKLRVLDIHFSCRFGIEQYHEHFK